MFISINVFLVEEIPVLCINIDFSLLLLPDDFYKHGIF